jgi:hypothetical protein
MPRHRILAVTLPRTASGVCATLLVLAGCGSNSSLLTPTSSTTTSPSTATASPSLSSNPGVGIATPTAAAPIASAAPPRSPYATEAVVTTFTVGVAWAAVAPDCDAFLSDKCQLTVRDFALLVSGSAARLKALAPAAASGDPPIQPIEDALAVFAQATASILSANSSGDSQRASTGFSMLIDASQQLTAATAGAAPGTPGVDSIPPLITMPIPESPGTRPAGGSSFTLAAQQEYASLDAGAVSTSSACMAIYADRCATAATALKTAIADATARLRPLASPPSRGSAASAVVSSLAELDDSVRNFSTANGGGASSGRAGLAEGLLRDGMWRLMVAIGQLRG